MRRKFALQRLDNRARRNYLSDRYGMDPNSPPVADFKAGDFEKVRRDRAKSLA